MPTDRQALPFPGETATPFVHLDLKSLAESIDGRLYTVCTTATRPVGAARFVGAPIYDTDKKGLYTWDGVTWVRHPQAVSLAAATAVSVPPNTAYGISTPSISEGSSVMEPVLDGLRFTTPGQVAITCLFYLPDDSRNRACQIMLDQGAGTPQTGVAAGPFAAAAGGSGFTDRASLSWTGRVSAGTRLLFTWYLAGSGISISSTATITGTLHPSA